MSLLTLVVMIKKGKFMEIQNYEVYNERMNKTLQDKIWWVEQIPEQVNTVIDFGCADGSLYKAIDAVCPERFHYIGIDNDSEMLQLATQNLPKEVYPNVEFYSSIYDMKNCVKANVNTIFVMNSILHELCSYLPPLKMMKLLEDIINLDCGYIAIRDMHAIKDCGEVNLENVRYKILTGKYSNQFHDYFQNGSYSKALFSTLNNYMEFLLKYLYVENWDREKKERYLWNWKDNVDYIFRPLYREKYVEYFNIPYLCSKIKEDFDGLDVSSINTHRKILFKRNW